MDNYTFIFDGIENVVETTWEFEFEYAIAISNDELIDSLTSRLTNGERTYFGASVDHFDPNEEDGNHASIITGYLFFENVEYLRVNDTYSTIPSWYTVSRHDDIFIDPNTGWYYPLKLNGYNTEWTLQWHIAWPSFFGYITTPKF